jgi:hypothetical protein
MKTLLFVLAVTGMTACGQANPTLAGAGEQGSSIVLASTIQTNTKTIDIIAFAPRDNDKVIVTCTSLLSGNPLDDRYNVLQSASFSYPPADGSQSLTLTGIKKDDGVLIYVDAKDSTNKVIGEGCRDSVEIKSGKTEEVQIIIYAAS